MKALLLTATFAPLGAVLAYALLGPCALRCGLLATGLLWLAVLFAPYFRKTP